MRPVHLDGSSVWGFFFQKPRRNKISTNDHIERITIASVDSTTGNREVAPVSTRIAKNMNTMHKTRPIVMVITVSRQTRTLHRLQSELKSLWSGLTSLAFRAQRGQVGVLDIK